MTGRGSTVPLGNYLGIDTLPFEMTYSMMARTAVYGIEARSFSAASAQIKQEGYERVSTS